MKWIAKDGAQPSGPRERRPAAWARSGSMASLTRRRAGPASRAGDAVTVSRDNSKAVYAGIKSAGIRSRGAARDVARHLLQLADDDPEMRLIEVAREEEAVGIAAGAYLAGARNALLMQNHGFLGSINAIVSLTMLYRIPLVMLIAHRGHWGEPYPWHTQGGIVTEPVLRALGLPFEYARDPPARGRADPGGADPRLVVTLAGRAAALARRHGGLSGRLRRRRALAGRGAAPRRGGASSVGGPSGGAAGT